MEKILKDETVLTKAKFIRTTCKNCNKELPKSVIFSGGKFCNKKCRKQFTYNYNKKYGLTKKQREALYEKELMSWGSNFSNETKHQGSQNH